MLFNSELFLRFPAYLQMFGLDKEPLEPRQPEEAKDDHSLATLSPVDRAHRSKRVSKAISIALRPASELHSGRTASLRTLIQRGLEGSRQIFADQSLCCIATDCRSARLSD